MTMVERDRGERSGVRPGVRPAAGTGAGTGAAERPGPPALRVSGLGYAYPDGHGALAGVSFDVAWGERLAVLGPNGAGKSTLCLHMAGLLLPQHGEVSVAGLAVTAAHAAEVRRRVGLVFQNPDDMLFMPTVRDDVAFGPANQGLAAGEVERRVTEALEAVDLSHAGDRPAHHLSFGERKRATIAAVLAMRPEVLVLDEPSANLDPRGRRELGELLDRLDVTVVLVTHDLLFALEHCARALVLDGGRTVADGPVAGVLADADLLAAHGLELPAGFSVELAVRVMGERAAGRRGGPPDAGPSGGHRTGPRLPER